MLAAKGKSHLAEELSKKEEDLEVLKAETERKAKIAKMAEDKSKALEKKVFLAKKMEMNNIHRWRSRNYKQKKIMFHRQMLLVRK